MVVQLLANLLPAMIPDYAQAPAVYVETDGSKRQLQLADSIVKEDLYTAYYAVSENEEIVADRNVEIPGMEEEAVFEKDVAVEPETNVVVMNPDNNQNEVGRQQELTDGVRKQQIDLEGIGISEIHNLSDTNVARVGESRTDITDKKW